MKAIIGFIILLFAFTSLALSSTAKNYVDLEKVLGAMTTTQRDALTLKKEGMIIYNTTDSTFQLYTSGAWSDIGGSSGGATTSLNNLASTAVNASIIPGTGSSINLGSASKRWSQTWTNSVNGNNGLVDLNSGLTAPSGGSASGMYSSAVTAVYTLNNAFADGNATSNVRLETGNKTAGTGNSGDIILQTGTSAGGTRGAIQFSANLVKFPTATADPSGAVEGAVYFNTTTHQLKVYANGSWVTTN